MSVRKNESKEIMKGLENLLRHAIDNIHKEQKLLKQDNIQSGGAKEGKTKKKKRKKRVKIAKSDTQETCAALIEIFKTGKEVIDKESERYQRILRCMSDENRRQLVSKKSDSFNFLYPNLNDPRFTEKITKKKEFSDTKYSEKTEEEYKNIEEISDSLCEVREFELDPHQMFVRNFLSFQTPYNSLLLYHGLGTGKTCSAIGVCEEMRSYLNQMGINKRIIIVASPVVQANFKLQLFDERKLKKINGEWNLYGCTGNKFIKEINPMNMKGLERDKIVKQIRRIISQSYLFLGYIQFANYISRIMDKYKIGKDADDKKKKRIQKALDKEFSNRLIVIDEAHNIRTSDSKELKRTSENLLQLVKYTDSLKLLLLSATPMFDKAREIVWLLNLMNLNDNRFRIRESDIFDANDNFKRDEQGNNIGQELLIQKAIGYISYVHGENPFTFPYRIWPANWGNPYSIKLKTAEGWKYPPVQINSTPIIEPLKHLDVLVLPIRSEQEEGYNYVLQKLKEDPRYSALNEPREGVQYTAIEGLKQTLNFVYPHSNMVNEKPNLLYGKGGLDRSMKYNEATKSNFSYKEKTLKEFGRIFSPQELPKYSSKISYICDQIQKSKGIILVYSQYIDGGGIPIALALEEIGFTRYGKKSKSLFAEPPTDPVDYKSMLPEQETKGDFHPAKYIMITGSDQLSPDKVGDMAAITNSNNSDGKFVKVVIISKAGSEGLDFKCIRQIHILEPWYNINRLDQIIGRGVRNLSHCLLPYNNRNVEIYLYGTEFQENDREAIDLYMYRLAERKAIQIGIVTRILKENATDCLLNRGQTQRLASEINVEVEQIVSSSDTPIVYQIGDKDNSMLCDFMSCGYKCKPFDGEITPNEISSDTYDEKFIIMNLDKILQRIRQLYKERYFYKREELITMINAVKSYPLDQIYSALNFFVKEKNEYLVDMLGRIGVLVNIGDYYLFQPVEIDNSHITRYERSKPIDFKRSLINFTDLPDIPLADDIIPLKSEKKEKEVAKIEKQSEQKSSSVIDYLMEQYDNIHTLGFIYSQDRGSWSKISSWSIRNLEKYNGMDKQVLERLAFEHVIDSLDFNKKFELCNYIYSGRMLDPSEQEIKNFFETYKISKGSTEGIILANYKSTTGFLWTIIVKKGKKWKMATQRDLLLLLPVAYKKFDIKNRETNEILETVNINTIFGFMTAFSTSKKSTDRSIVYKTKTLEKSNKGRVLGGRVCYRGVQKIELIQQINNILPKKNGNPKYIIDADKSRKIQAIYGDTDIIQMAEKKLDKKRKLVKNPKRSDVKLNTLQLCIELELILRYYNSINHENKLWFFSTVYDSINNLEKLSK